MGQDPVHMTDDELDGVVKGSDSNENNDLQGRMC